MSSSLPPKRSMSLLRHRELTSKRKKERQKPDNESDSDYTSEPDCQQRTPALSVVDASWNPSPDAVLKEDPPTKKRPRKIFESNPKQRWTELTAIGHVLADEVYMYVHESLTSEDTNNELTQGEQRQLTNWSMSVEKRIHQQSGLVLENVHLATELRQSLSSVQGLRDDLMVLRTQTRRLEIESEELETQVTEATKNDYIVQRSSSFLYALQALRQTCRNER